MKLAQYFETGSSNTYMLNVRRTGRAFVQALLAGASAHVAEISAKPRLTEGMRNSDIKTLYQLASDYDSISPKLADELRAIAARH